MFLRSTIVLACGFAALPPLQQERPQEPRADPKSERQSAPTDAKDDAAAATRAASSLMYADSYRFRAEVARTPNDEALARGRGDKQDERVARARERAPVAKRLEIEGRYQSGKPLQLTVPAAGLVAYRDDQRLVFKDEGESWAALPLDSRLFGGEGKARIGGGDDRRKAGAGGAASAGSPRDRRAEDVDPDEEKADLQALAYLGVIPAPHALLRAVVEGGFAQATRRVERSGAAGAEEIVYDCRMSPAAEQLCRDHFARLLTPAGYEKVPALDASVRVVAGAAGPAGTEGADASADVKRVVLEMRPGREARHAAIGLRIAYDLEEIGRVEVDAPAGAKGRLGE